MRHTQKRVMVATQVSRIFFQELVSFPLKPQGRL